MGEIAGMPPFGGGGLNVRHVAEAAPPMLAPIAESGSSSDLSDQMDGQTGQSQSGNAGAYGFKTPDALVTPMPKANEHTLAGPPPAFQVSLLELDAKLRETLARFNAEQSFGREERATDADAPVEAAPQSYEPQDRFAAKAAENDPPIATKSDTSDPPQAEPEQRPHSEKSDPPQESS